MAENSLKPFHFPGANFIGPGTPVGQNILNDVQPTSVTDAAARQHDIDYLKNAGDSTFISDVRAITSSYPSFSPDALALRAGLSVKTLFDIYSGQNTFNTALPDMTIDETKRYGEILQKELDLRTPKFE